ncbi:GFA family protein [Sphingomonas sp. 8AM]|uniref:GFA family protein n=1 Tax=Sphingomonas sp. 8AM TaxID=2653170 RepID=UPI0012F1D94B
MTIARHAHCRCGQLTATCFGAPVRVSACHCRACQRRTGGPFSAQARFPIDKVTIAGAFRVWERVAESGRHAWYRWCGECGGTIAYTNEGLDGLIAIPIGAFADDANDVELHP